MGKQLKVGEGYLREEGQFFVLDLLRRPPTGL